MLEREGELVRVSAEADPNLEIAEIVHRSVRRAGRHFVVRQRLIPKRVPSAES